MVAPRTRSPFTGCATPDGGSIDVLNLTGDGDPGVFASFVDRYERRLKRVVGKASDRDGDEPRRGLERVVNGRAPLGTEVERHFVPTISGSDIRRRRAYD